jgi:hypothetical protein
MTKLDSPETCKCCGRYTERGKNQLAMEHRARLGIAKPLSEEILTARLQIAAIRGRLSDIGSAYTGWRDRLDSVQGLLTCGLMALHHTMEEMREHERRYPPDRALGETPQPEGKPDGSAV